MKTLTQSFKTIALALILALGVSYVSAWTAPTAAPTDGNVASPLNTSVNSQYKTGILTIGTGFESYGTTLLSTLSGNVGIGTTAPGSKLEVRAPTNGSYNTVFRGRSNDGMNTIDLNLQNDGTANLGGSFTNFGIGTTNPTQKLEVSGNIKASGDIKSNNMIANGYRLNLTPTISYGGWQANWLCCGGGPGNSDTCDGAGTAIYTCSGSPKTCIDTADQEQVTGDTGCGYCGKVGGYYRNVDCGTTAVVGSATWVGQ